MTQYGTVFADSEGDDLYPEVSRIWTIQIALDEDSEVEVFADQPGYRPISDAITILKNCEKAVFHNGMGYDLLAINKLYPGTLKPEQIIDTLVMSRFNNPSARRHSLADIGEHLGFRKGDHSDFSKFSEEMAVYGKRDVQILQRLWKGEPKKKVPSFRKLYLKYTEALDREFYTAYVISRQIVHGFRFDYTKGQELEAEFRQEKKDLERELQEVFPPIVTERYSEKQIDKKTGKPKRLKDSVEVFNPGSRDQIAQRLKDRYGWKPKAKTETGKAKVDEEILDTLEYPEAKSIARFMKLGKKLGQLADGTNAWMKTATAYTDDTFYLHGYVNTLGTRTGRMSHSKPNLAQVDGDHRMRELFLPDPDQLLLGVDAEGLELRMLAHYLALYDEGAYGRAVHEGKKEDETDVHNMNKKAAALFLRDSAKTMIYAHNYGCGDAKLGLIVRQDAKEAGEPIPEGSDTALGKALRSKIETRVDGLGLLIGKCKKLHMKRESMPGLDGRWIPSASAHSALNTLLQGNGSIVMKEALNLFDREMKSLQLMDKFDYCANVHDEFQLTVHPDYAEAIAKVGKESITRAGETLEVRCPLVGSADIGKSWAETH